MCNLKGPFNTPCQTIKNYDRYNGYIRSCSINQEDKEVFINERYAGKLISFDGKRIEYEVVSDNHYMNGLISVIEITES
jgi:hypothetical protein